MKKSICLFLGLSMLGACSIGVLSSIENESKVASADTYLGKATDVISSSSFSKWSTMSTGGPTTCDVVGTESNASYKTTIKRLLRSGTGDVNTEKKACFVYEYGKKGDTIEANYGFYVTATVGYVRSVEVEYANYDLIGGTPGELAVFGQQDPYYGTTDMFYEELRGTDIGVLTYSSQKLEIKGNYKYIGFGSVEDTGPTYIKSITINWDLYEFSGEEEDDITWDIDEEEGVDMEYGDTHQVTAETSGEGASTDGEIVWETANPLIATVDDEGVITATGGGHTTITATYGDVYIEGDVWVDEYVNPVTKVISQVGNTQTVRRMTEPEMLKAGDIVMIVCEEYGKALGSVETDEEYGVAVDCTIDATSHTITDAGEGAMYFIVNGDSENGYSFTSLDGQTISYENDEDYTGIAANYSKCLFDVTIGYNGTAVISNKAASTKYLKYSDTSESFDICPQGPITSIYKADITVELPYEINDLVGYDSPALTFAHDFLNKISAICVSSGETNSQALSNAWASVFSDSNDAFAAMNTISMLMLENAENDANGDTIQKAVALYDYILVKYGLEDNLNRGISSASRVVTKNASGTMIIVVTSILISGTIALAIIGAYRFRNKSRKEK